MQIANCHVRLSGDMTNEVFKPGVTPAEVAVLRALHGANAVVKIQPTVMDKRPHAQEFDRLKQAYGDKVVTAAFPGALPQLPVNFKDIGIDVYADDKPARAPRKGKDDKGSEEGATAGADAGTGAED